MLRRTLALLMPFRGFFLLAGVVRACADDGVSKDRGGLDVDREGAGGKSLQLDRGRESLAVTSHCDFVAFDRDDDLLQRIVRGVLQVDHE